MKKLIVTAIVVTGMSLILFIFDIDRFDCKAFRSLSPLSKNNKHNSKTNLTYGIKVSSLQENVYETRKKEMLRNCHQEQGHDSNFSSISEETLRRLIVDDKYKIIYCPIHKIATTNWRRLFLFLAGKLNSNQILTANNIHRKLSLKFLKTLSTNTREEASRKLSNYLTVIIVRDPIDRLMSAFRDKFHQNYTGTDAAFKKYAKTILNQFRPNATRKDLTTLNDLRFGEFVKYLLSTPHQFNMHWEMYHKLCQPCAIAYDVIGKFETMSQDVSYVLKKIGLNISFPEKYHQKEHIPDYFRDTSQTDLKEIGELYALDYKLFGYKFHIPDDIK